MSIFYLIIGLVLLVIGGEFLVRSSVGLSLKLNLSRMIIGLTVVSFATSAPELIVSIQSAMDGLSGLALGNVIGSNIANIALVLGATALIAPMMIEKDFFKFNWPWMMLFSVVLYGMLHLGNNLERWEGVALVGLIILFLVLLIRRARKNPEAVDLDEVQDESKWWKIVLFLVLGGIALWQGSELLVNGAVQIASDLGVSEDIIGLTMVAIGTSVPELAASIIAAVKQEKAISLGNLIGSNIFNIGSVLGITAVIEPFTIDTNSMEILNNNLFWMIGVSFSILPLAYIARKFEITRFKGALYVLSYAIFTYLAFNTL